MGKASGTGRDLAALEARRLEAIPLPGEEGLDQSQVARRLGVARQTVVHWLAQYRAHGRRGLRRAERAGRKPRLSAAERPKLVRLLERGPQALGDDTPR